MPNLLRDLPAAAREAEQFEDILNAPGVRIERIISHGQSDPQGAWQRQGWDEWVLLIEGAARLAIKAADGNTSDIALTPGDHLLIPAGTRHRVAFTDPDRPTIWLAVHIGET